MFPLKMSTMSVCPPTPYDEADIIKLSVPENNSDGAGYARSVIDAELNNVEVVVNKGETNAIVHGRIDPLQGR